jgi:ribosomal-protein-alanine N-acetyltransferase
MVYLRSNRLIFKTLTLEDVTDKYVTWLNDPEVNRYLEVRYFLHNIEGCRQFVKQVNDDQSQHLFGIFMAQEEESRHVGNIKLGFVNHHHRRGQLSLFIGEKDCWGKGLGTEAIKTITQWGFDRLALEKLEAGCYEENLGSLKAFLRAGYQVEGFFRKHLMDNGRRTGSFWLGILPYEVV